MQTPAPFEIVDGPADSMVGSNGQASAMIFRAEGGRLFRRRAVALNRGTGQQQRTEWIVAELDGVRAYFDGANVVVTRQNLQP